MAYQFFSKAHQSKNKPLSTAPLSQSPYKPPIYPQPPVPPPSSISAASSATLESRPPSNTTDTAVQPTPYPHPIAPGYPTPHPHITIETVSTVHIPSLTRITGLLLPIRYSNSFYTAIITDPVVASLSRVAIYHDHPVAAAPASSSLASTSSAPNASNAGADKVIGGIRCRLERLPQTTSELLRNNHTQQSPALEPTNLYIQTLHLLSPYRGNGVAASLINSLLFAMPPGDGSTLESAEVSGLVKHYNIRSITAHVHEANDDALRWYIARGFQVQNGVIENYYRRLKPSGARIVKLTLQWSNEGNTESQEKKDEGPKDGNQDIEKSSHDGDDEDWEKIEAEDDEHEDHGVQLITDSKLLDIDEGGSRKRKAEGEPQPG